MYQDAHGLDLTAANSDAVAAYDTAVKAFLEYRLSTGDHIKASLEADPDFPMGLCFRGYLLMQLGTTAIYPKVRAVQEQAKARAADGTKREALHAEALGHWLDGHVGEACRIWGEILAKAPQDLLALRLHHFLSFWQGNRGSLRDVPLTSLAAVDQDLPGYGFIQGMVAFGHEECGSYVQAERFGRAAVERNGDDLWAIHAVSHVLEMQGRYDEGTSWLGQPFGTWEDRNPFKDHVWWHLALFELELGKTDRVLEIYDREVKVDEGVFYLDVQNAASLLMRLELAGVDVGPRWDQLADLTESRIDDHVIAFTDTQFVLSLAGARRKDSAQRYLESLQRYAANEDTDTATVTAGLGVRIAEGLVAYSGGHYAQTVERLLPIRHDLGPIGGSHAQHDIFHQLLIDATLREGRTELARILLMERAVIKPNSSWAQDHLAALH